MTIYLIEKLWIDNFENNADSSYGYKIVGYVLVESTAKSIVSGCKVYPESCLWSFIKDMPEYRYTEVELWNPLN